MDFFKEIGKALEAPKDQRWVKFEKILEKLSKKDSLFIKNVLDELSDDLTQIRKENEEVKQRRIEIQSEIRDISKQKEYLAETAMGADINTFKEIKLAISDLSKKQDELNEEIDELGEPDEDNNVDNQKLSTFCENWGNQSSVIDVWATAVYKVKVLLSDKLMDE
ncbi:MAG: hypothetical protein SFU25_11225 [Candidatus Caenarcaniphilales bacterium]|nr:hypothetical protein [Candidatus Caenarcaniphilales bacterium]